MDDKEARKIRLLEQLQLYLESNHQTQRLRKEFEANLTGFLGIDELPVTIDWYIDFQTGSRLFANLDDINIIVREARKE